MSLQGSINALVNMSGSVTESGAGSQVAYQQVVDNGTLLGTITIDGSTSGIYAPAGSGGGSEVEYTQIVQTGTKIGTITIDDVSTDIYAPTGGSGGSTVSFSRSKNSGTALGTLTIDGVATTLYCDTISAFEYYGNTYNRLDLTINNDPAQSVGFQVNQTVNGMNDVAIATLANNNVLKWSGTDHKWENSFIKMDEVDDVALYSLSNGDTLIYNSSAHVWENGTTSLDLDDLQDVVITNPTNGQVLKYHAMRDQWINEADEGTPVIANPSGTATGTLNKVSISGLVYNIPSGGGGGGVNYSTTEQDTGLTWIDGRPIYQKTFYMSTFSATIDSSFTPDIYDHYWQKDITWRYDSGGYHYVGGSFGGVGGPLYTEADSRGLLAANNTGVSPEDIYITIQYTKTADITP